MHPPQRPPSGGGGGGVGRQRPAPDPPQLPEEGRGGAGQARVAAEAVAEMKYYIFFSEFLGKVK